MAKENMKFHMQNIYNNYVELFNSKSSEKEKLDHLNKIEKYILSSSFDKMIDSPILNPIKSSLKQSFKEIKSAHINGEKKYSEYRAKKLIALCISCHSQLPSKSFKPLNQKRLGRLKSVTDKYNMALLFRDYKLANSILEDRIFSEVDQKEKPYKLQLDLDKIVDNYLTHLQDRKGLEKFLNKINLNFKKNKELLTYIYDFQLSLKKWNNEEIENIKESNLKMLIKKYLVPLEDDLSSIYFIAANERVTTSILKGMLTEYLLLYPDRDFTPEALYWRALLEKQHDSIDFYSLADLYNTECILRYSKSKFAKKCYQNLERSTRDGFTGSSGTNIPKEVKKSLENLKRHLN